MFGHLGLTCSVVRQARGLRFFAPPPPAGGAAVLAAVQMLAAYQASITFAASTSSSKDIGALVQGPLAFSGRSRTHRLVEVMKNAFAMRSNLGDPGRCEPGEIPSTNSSCFQDLQLLLMDMLSPAYADSLKSHIMDNATQSALSYGGEWTVAGNPEDHGTSHLCVCDSQHNAVSFTTTINTAFGSKLMSQSTGIILNNQMDDFSTPDQVNVYGLPPSEPNFIRPFKKPQSSMSPLVVVNADGRVRAILGASGGPRIISALIQTLFRLVDLGDGLLRAILLPRVHNQVVPNDTLVEEWSAGGADFRVPQQEILALTDRGHHVAATSWGAVVQGILVDPVDGTLTGVSDPRKDGAPAGY